MMIGYITFGYLNNWNMESRILDREFVVEKNDVLTVGTDVEEEFLSQLDHTDYYWCEELACLVKYVEENTYIVVETGES